MDRMLKNVPLKAWNIVCLFVGTAYCGSLAAQEELSKGIESSIADGLWSAYNTGPDGNILGEDSEVSFQLYDENETVNLKYELGTSVTPGVQDRSFHKVWSYSVAAAVPSNSEDKNNPLPTLDALSNAYTVSAIFNYSLIRSSMSSVFQSFSVNDAEFQASTHHMFRQLYVSPNDVSAECKSSINEVLAGNFRFQEILDELNLSNQQLQDMTNFEILFYARENPEKLSGLDNAVKAYVIEGRFEQLASSSTYFAEKCLPSFYDAKIKSAWDQGLSYNFALEMKYGNENFEVTDSMEFSTSKVIKDVSAITLKTNLRKGYGADATNINNFSASFSYQDGYEEAEKTVMCQNGGVNPETDCKEAVFSEPTAIKKKIFSVEWRARYENVLGNQPVAFNLTGSYDLENESYGVDLPVYLFSLGGEDLNAGIRFGWQDETDTSAVGFFYGQKF